MWLWQRMLKGKQTEKIKTEKGVNKIKREKEMVRNHTQEQKILVRAYTAKKLSNTKKNRKRKRKMKKKDSRTADRY